MDDAPRTPSAAEPAEIFVVSDGTGETASSAVRAAMLQFDPTWKMRVFGDVRTEAEAGRVLDAAARAGALLVYTLVDERVAELVRTRAAERGIPAVDLLGPLIREAGRHLGAKPRLQPGLLHRFSDEYFRRVEAVEFAVRHDDGANLRTLHQADIVLTGVSRTSKTPLTMYLAQRGYKAGNVPLIPGLEPPRELLELNPRKVFGLVMRPDLLITIRNARVRALHGSPYSAYADPDSVVAELRRARRLFRERGWRIVDVSGRAVEENASRILELLEGRGWAGSSEAATGDAEHAPCGPLAAAPSGGQASSASAPGGREAPAPGGTGAGPDAGAAADGKPEPPAGG